MELFYWESPAGNFGDDMNLWLWDSLLPGWQAWDEGRLLVGVGTVLNSRVLPHRDRYLVVGSGAGYGDLPPLEPRGAWDIRFVRGPGTARALGLDPGMAVTDPASMVARLDAFADCPRPGGTLFVPHCHSDIDPGYDWPSICDEAGIGYQSSRAEAKDVIRRIAGADLVITESMHGAIIADAFRVPWRAVSLTANFNHFKWRDWASSVGVEDVSIAPLPRPVNRVRDMVRSARSMLPRPARQTVPAPEAAASGGPGLAVAERPRSGGLKNAGIRALTQLQRHQTVRALRHEAKGEGRLSESVALNAKLDRMEHLLRDIRESYAR